MSAPNLEDVERLRARVRSIGIPGMTVEESQKAYGDWAATYEQDLLKCGYSPHLAVSKKMCEKFPSEKRAEVRILDVADGTGLVAKELKKHGFKHIDALEPQEQMLNEAKKLELYENYINTFITGDPLDIKEDSYDVITGSGIYAQEANVPCEALIEMIRLVKPGGFIIIAIREALLEETETMKKLEPLMKKLETDGKWKMVSREIWPRFYMDVNGIVWCYEVI